MTGPGPARAMDRPQPTPSVDDVVKRQGRVPPAQRIGPTRPGPSDGLADDDPEGPGPAPDRDAPYPSGFPAPA